MVKEVRLQKHTYVCSKGRTVMCRTVLMHANGSENSVDLCTMKICRCQTAHVGERGEVAEVSEASKATCGTKATVGYILPS